MKGKIIGAIIGGFFGGPVGAAVGIATGHVFDSVAGSPKPALSAPPDEILNLICAGVAKIAKADGSVSEAEISEIEKIFADLNFDSETRRRAVACFRTAKADSATLDAVARRFAQAMKDPQARSVFFIIMMRVALADGAMKPSVRAALLSAAEILGVDARRFGDFSESRPSAENSKLAEAYAVLGISSGASDEEIKKVYRAKCKELHPDVLRSKGIGEYAVAALENELRRVNGAYEIIEKYRKG